MSLNVDTIIHQVRLGEWYYLVEDPEDTDDLPFCHGTIITNEGDWRYGRTLIRGPFDSLEAAEAHWEQGANTGWGPEIITDPSSTDGIPESFLSDATLERR